MSRPRLRATRDRAFEALGWVAALATGAFVLLPAILEWAQARQWRAEETRRERDLAEDAAREDRLLLHITQDPLTDRRLQETPDADLRSYREQTGLNPPTSHD